MQFLGIIAFMLVNVTSFAQTLKVHGPSEAKILEMARHNSELARAELALGPILPYANVKPFFEYDKTGYIIMSDDDFNGIARSMKQTIAQNLPVDTTLIVYTQSSDPRYQQRLLAQYSKYIPPDRLKILNVPESGDSDFWSRDNIPVPLWQNGKLAVVDARYYYDFEPDAFFAKLFQGALFSHGYYFEGGNFTVNSRGECLIVNRKRGLSDTAAIPDDIFKIKYGCNTVTRFKHLKGIGHSDEVVKFLTDDIVVTDTVEYIETLKDAGYQVHVLPEAEYNYETYVNSLLVNGVLFVPVFGEANDQKALDVYKNLNLGFKIVPINSRDLSTQGQGSIHCITMNYPPVTLTEIMRTLKGKSIQ